MERQLKILWLSFCAGSCSTRAGGCWE